MRRAVVGHVDEVRSMVRGWGGVGVRVLMHEEVRCLMSSARLRCVSPRVHVDLRRDDPHSKPVQLFSRRRSSIAGFSSCSSKT